MDRERAKEEIRNRIKCTDYLEPSKGGMYCCPFCGSGHGPHGTGALKYYPESNTWACFACATDGDKARTGDVIDLYQKETGKDFNTALFDLAAIAGIKIDEPARSGRSSAAEDFAEYQDPDPARPQALPEIRAAKDYTEYYQQCRQRITAPEAVAYLQARGISIEAAIACGLGYDPAADPTRSGYKMPRLIIPYTSAFYAARRMDNIKDYRYSFPKGSSKNGIFDPEGALYSGRDAIYVTEGAMDAVSIIEAGGSAIAIDSSSGTGKLLELLEEKATSATLLLCLDNDEVGRAAARPLEQRLQQLNISYLNCSQEICGEYKDPNEALTAQGREHFAAAVKATAAKADRPHNTLLYIENDMRKQIEKFKEGRERKTGFANLDREAGGLYPGLYVIAAISSLGKTSFALQAADQIAAAGNDVIYFSLEQSRLELVSKSLARFTCNADPAHPATALQIRQGVIDDGILGAMENYKTAIADRLSIVEGNFSCNVSFIREYTRQYMQRTGTKPVIFIDYLQILQGEPEKRQSTKELIDSTVTELKRISRELDITVFVISSLNRANYLVPVSFESLKESGSIEYSADVIYGLQLRCINEDLFSREGKIKEKRERIRMAKTANPREIELLCLKNRYGISSFSCYFDYYPANDLFIPASDFDDELD